MSALYFFLVAAERRSASHLVIVSTRCLWLTSWKDDVRGINCDVRLDRKCIWRRLYRLVPKSPPCVSSDSRVGVNEMAEEREGSVRSSGMSERRVGTW